MAHRRSPSALQALNSSTSSQQSMSNNKVVSASGVGIAAVMAAAATAVTSALPTIRSSTSLDGDDVELSLASSSSSSSSSMSLSSMPTSLDLDFLRDSPLTPGTPSKDFPHPPRVALRSSPATRRERTAFETRKFLSRLQSVLSPARVSPSGLPFKSSSSAASPSTLASLPTRAHAPLRRRATFLCLFALLALSAWTILTTSLADQHSSTSHRTSRNSYSPAVLKGWKDWRNKAQHLDPEERKRLLASASFRATASSGVLPPVSDSTTNNGDLVLTPADELAALTAFMAALPWNALPPHMNPTAPLDPSIILDFSVSHPRAHSELEAMKRETWSMNPVVLFGRGRHAGTREAMKTLEGLGVQKESVVRFDVEERSDVDTLLGVLHRLVSALSPALDAGEAGQLELPLLLIAGQPIRASEIPSLLESGDLAKIVRASGVRLGAGKTGKKGH